MIDLLSKEFVLEESKIKLIYKNNPDILLCEKLNFASNPIYDIILKTFQFTVYVNTFKHICNWFCVFDSNLIRNILDYIIFKETIAINYTMCLVSIQIVHNETTS